MLTDIIFNRLNNPLTSTSEKVISTHKELEMSIDELLLGELFASPILL